MPEPQHERPKSQFLAILLIVAVGGILVARMPGAITARMADAEFTEPVIDIAHLVDRYYYRDYDEEELRLGAIRGMLDTLGDPYSEYIPPSRQQEFDKVVRGEFVGIGAEIRMTAEGWLQITSPMDDSPALIAGLQAGDLVVGVDGASTWQRDVDLIIADLTGRPGTDVRITVERRSEAGPPPSSALEPTVAGEVLVDSRPAGQIGSADQPVTAPGPAEDSERFDLIITRDRIRTQTVRGLHRDGQDWLWMVDPENSIAYVRISQFTDETTPRLLLVLTELLDRDMNGLVLDLRRNSGGSLAAAVQIANLLLESGEIVSVEGRNRPRYTERASARGTLPDFPIALLVDRSSASASEILAGALSDNGRAIVIGERTFGKGLVQAIVPLPSGNGQLKITEADYYLPSGRSLHRQPDSEVWGVDPTPGYGIELSEEQLIQLWTIRREEEVLRPDKDAEDSSWSDPLWIRERLQDPPLALAVEALQHRLEHGTWPDRTETVTDETAEPARP